MQHTGPTTQRLETHGEPCRICRKHLDPHCYACHGTRRQTVLVFPAKVKPTPQPERDEVTA